MIAPATVFRLRVPRAAAEILVCHLTDPASAPAFDLASAVVTDGGGLSGHGAIVRREMGLPLVINTVSGTSVSPVLGTEVR